jgi:threonine dehydratase
MGVVATDWVSAIDEAAARLAPVLVRTPLEMCKRLSERHGARVLLKREDRQEVRSFKIRGAYNKVASLSAKERSRGVVCASAGNHAQGVAFACARLAIRATVFMPAVTPLQKIERVLHFGREWVEVRLLGDSYDDADAAAQAHCEEQGAVFVHPFDDPLTIAGQGTIARELVEELGAPPDLLVAGIGGGGLISGIAGYLKTRRPAAVVIGAEPAGAPSMTASLRAGRVVALEEIDTFVDGAAVKRVGELTFDLCRQHLDDVVLVPEGQVCTSIIELDQNEGIISEPAGALAVAALDNLGDRLRDQTVVCVLSGGNNDILRYPEIMERSLVHQGRKHYFIVEFAQKPGQLRRFVDQALGPTDDIVRFEYMKKTNKERGAALVGVELKSKDDLEPLLERMREVHINARPVTSEELLYDYLI